MLRLPGIHPKRVTIHRDSYVRYRPSLLIYYFSGERQRRIQPHLVPLRESAATTPNLRYISLRGNKKIRSWISFFIRKRNRNLSFGIGNSCVSLPHPTCIEVSHV